LRRHAVIVGDRPPLLLVHGWPETWYAWRLLMPALARDFEVISVDQRGIGLSDKPQDGYDSGTLAGDLVALMAALGHSVSAPSSPPRRPAETLQGLGRPASLQLLLEDRPSFLLRTSGERRPPLAQVVHVRLCQCIEASGESEVAVSLSARHRHERGSRQKSAEPYPFLAGCEHDD
jgi:hypothetical protein